MEFVTLQIYAFAGALVLMLLLWVLFLTIQWCCRRYAATGSMVITGPSTVTYRRAWNEDDEDGSWIEMHDFGPYCRRRSAASTLADVESGLLDDGEEDELAKSFEDAQLTLACSGLVERDGSSKKKKNKKKKKVDTELVFNGTSQVEICIFCGGEKLEA